MHRCYSPTSSPDAAVEPEVVTGFHFLGAVAGAEPQLQMENIPRAQDLLLCTGRVTGTSFEQTPVRTVNLNYQALKHSI